MNIHTITFDNIIELLKEVTDIISEKRLFSLQLITRLVLRTLLKNKKLILSLILNILHRILAPFFTDKTLVTILKVVPLNRDVQELILWKIIYHITPKTTCFVCRIDPPWGKIIPRIIVGIIIWILVKLLDSAVRKNELDKLKNISKYCTSFVHPEDILEDSPLYAELEAYLSQKQKGDTFASIAKDDIDDIKLFEKRYLINKLYFPCESYKAHLYYKTILISTDSAEFLHFSGYNTKDWGISLMKERQINLNKVPTSFTY
ncbi:hypothetical protein H5410_004771 [Solanum commersonii]|uniref:Uncharacterized protein n=1 Tax=Solanum commersonii TaxID=4109 RepID=A0A9J6A4S9_SOLCO|nr:hypothetical protein H5410_004771 [Solanum commersonii]